jgi:hypothetical protein
VKVVLTIVWYPWTEGAGGPAGTSGDWKNLYLELPDAKFVRLPGVGETIFFEDGGSAVIEAVGWKLDGSAYLYLGKRLERKGEPLELWLGRGFRERAESESLDRTVTTQAQAPPTTPYSG